MQLAHQSHLCLDWAIWIHLVNLCGPEWVPVRQFWVLYLDGISNIVTIIPEISERLLFISSIWSLVLELENIWIQGYTLGLLASWERVDYYSLFVLPLPVPTEDTKYSQSLFENEDQANHQLHYIQNLVTLGCVITGFYYNSERECCQQKTFSC